MIKKMKILTILLLAIILLNLVVGCNYECENHIDIDYNYLCDTCGDVIKGDYESPIINTKANDTFFPTEKTVINQEELMSAYEKYLLNNNLQEQLKVYKIYNLTPKEKILQYNLDFFVVEFENSSLYYIKYKEDIFSIVPFDLNNNNFNCLTHIAISDINDDGYLEILTSVNSFADRGQYYYCHSFIRITDTYTKKAIDIPDYSNISYFKENESGVISIYNTNGIYPLAEDVINGKLDEKYYYLATNLLETPELNTSKYIFKDKKITKECSLFNVEITIDDSFMSFPYLFKSTYTPVSFFINSNMTYLGDSFSYTKGDSYLDGAVVYFENSDSKIYSEPVDASTVITKFFIFKGMKIEHTYKYCENLNNLSNVGIYDMIIEYANKENHIREKIIIKNFLLIMR